MEFAFHLVVAFLDFQVKENLQEKLRKAQEIWTSAGYFAGKHAVM